MPVFVVPLMILLSILLSGCRTENRTVRLAFLGDIMPGRGVDLTEDSLKYLEASLQSADLAMANLESALTTFPPDTTDGYKLCASPDNARILVESGLDMVSVVNNHSLDCGKQGHTDTLAAIESNGLIPVDETGYTTIIHGVKLTFFAFEDISSAMDIASAVHTIQNARSNGSTVIVSMHWGMEYQGGASDRQKDLAEQLSAAGANLIWGHHPHVLQPADWIPAECEHEPDKNGCSLVLYSLGNALFDQAGLLDTRRSALVTVVLDEDGILSTRITPFMIDPVHSLLLSPDKSSSELIISRLQLP